MVTTKMEVPISKLIDKIGTKVQRLYIYVYEIPSDIQTISTLGTIPRDGSRITKFPPFPKILGGASKAPWSVH